MLLEISVLDKCSLEEWEDDENLAELGSLMLSDNDFFKFFEYFKHINFKEENIIINSDHIVYIEDFKMENRIFTRIYFSNDCIHVVPDIKMEDFVDSLESKKIGKTIKLKALYP